MRLAVNTYLGQTRQIDEGQAENVRRVDLEVDGLAVDALVVACYSGCLGLDLAPDVVEVEEPSARDVKKLSPLLGTMSSGRCVTHVYLVIVVFVFALAGEVDELEDERPSSDDAAATGKKVPADNVLEHRRLSCRL